MADDPFDIQDESLMTNDQTTLNSVPAITATRNAADLTNTSASGSNRLKKNVSTTPNSIDRKNNPPLKIVECQSKIILAKANSSTDKFFISEKRNGYKFLQLPIPQDKKRVMDSLNINNIKYFTHTPKKEKLRRTAPSVLWSSAF